MTGGNTPNPRRMAACDAVRQRAFRLGVDDWRARRPLAEADAIPALDGIPDTAGNRQRVYEVGRLVAAFARSKRRKIDANAVRAAKREGYLP